MSREVALILLGAVSGAAIIPAAVICRVIIHSIKIASPCSKK